MKIAVIPARGGSKRIPYKNIKLFSDKPLIAHSIQVALKTGLFDKVIVSTDDQKIADVAVQYGAEVPFMRPNTLADDFTGTTPVVRHAIQYYLDLGQPIDFCCCIYATAPLLQAEYLIKGFEQLQAQNNACFAFSVTSFPFPIQRALKLNQAGVAPMYPEFISQRSQDLTQAYHDAGQFYWGRSEAYMAGKKMFAPHSIPIILPRHLVQDIDTMEDWQSAEMLYQLLNQKTRPI